MLPVIPNDISESMQLYLNQLNAKLFEYLPPSIYTGDRLFEIDQLCTERDTSGDYDEDDLTCNGADHELDISSIVGKQETLVRIRLRVKDDAVGSYVALKTNGATNPSLICRTQVANEYNDASDYVKTDASGIIEYVASAVTFTEIDIYILGWHPVYLIGG